MARIGDRRGAYRVLVARLREVDYLKDLGIDGMIILKWISEKWDGETWTEWIWLRTGTGRRAFVIVVMKLRVP